MNPRLPRLVLVALLCVATAYAEDRKMCTATPAECEQAIRQLSSGRRYFGAKVEDLAPGPGVTIRSVIAEGPAERAGLAAGDRLMSVNGKSMLNASVKDFKQILSESKDTGRLSIVILRRGMLKRIDVRLEPYTKAQIDRMVAQHLANSHTPAAATASTAAPQQ